MPYRRPDPRFPRIVGIDTPWRAGTYVSAEDAFIVLLNCEPTEAWRESFMEEFKLSTSASPGRRAHFDSKRILIHGTIGDPRELAKEIRQLVESVSQIRQGLRIQEAEESSGHDVQPRAAKVFRTQ